MQQHCRLSPFHCRDFDFEYLLDEVHSSYFLLPEKDLLEIWIMAQETTGRVFKPQSILIKTQSRFLLNKDMASQIPPNWLVFFVICISSTWSQETTTTTKPRCPSGTLNEGWFVQRAYAFADPLDCCDQRVRSWKAFDEYEPPYTETGCLLFTMIQTQELTRFLAPMGCSNSSTCGDRDFFGNRMECCSSNELSGGFCAAIPASEISRCDRVADMKQWSSEEETNEHLAEREFTHFANDCYAASDENDVCLTCSSSCPDGTKKSDKGLIRSTRMSLKDKIKSHSQR